ncbi:MAG TPA: Ldh family oxidoreductase, partial [Thermoleophilia bacterium]|nr:Ldh family oxidoreductase [Thermoleophilia bacterium]
MSTQAAPQTVTVTLDHRELHRLLQGCFAGVGLSAGDADAVATVLVDANLCGIESHGVERAPIYMKRVTEGLAHGTEGATVVFDAGAICRVDAGHALGPAISIQAIDRAVEMAATHGIGLVAVGRSTHFGHAGFYVRRAADRGMIAMAASNAPATMAPHGAAEPFLGANPLAIGVPLDGDLQFVLDFSTSVIARGRIRRANALRLELEPGTAIDADGLPTTDP